MKWLAIAPGDRTTLVIACVGIVTWHEARTYASRTIGADAVLETEETAVEDVEIRWTGTDAGDPPTRRMQHRKRGESAWKDAP